MHFLSGCPYQRFIFQNSLKRSKRRNGLTNMLEDHCISFSTKKIIVIGMLIAKNQATFIKFRHRGEFQLNSTIMPHCVPRHNHGMSGETQRFILIIQVGKVLRQGSSISTLADLPGLINPSCRSDVAILQLPISPRPSLK